MKTIVITGITGSIGKATAYAMAQHGDVRLILAGRNTAKIAPIQLALNKGNVQVEVLELDLNDTASVARAVAQLKNTCEKIDALVNVAAVYKGQKTMNANGREVMFATNHLGPFMFTNGLLPLLKAAPGSKVLTVSAPSSTKIDFENLNGEKKFSALTAFGATKMMNLLFAFRLAKEFDKSGHASIAFHPGLVKSELLNDAPAFLRGLLRMISTTPEKTANAIADIIFDKDAVSQNGKFYNNKRKEMRAAALAYDDNVQQQLWQVSEKMVNE